MELNVIQDGIIERLHKGLAYAHGNGILHRDIKPANIILGPDGAPRLTDFGLALDLRALGLTMAGEQFGTPQYMSPEQIVRQENPVDARSDGYSLAVTLYELLTLRLPYKADSTPELLTAVQRAEVVAPRQVDPAIEPELEKVLLRGLKKDPDERYQTLAECKQALEALLECWPKPAPPPAPPSRKQTIITALFGALALIAVLLFWQLRDSGSPGPVAARGLPKQLAMGGIEVGDWILGLFPNAARTSIGLGAGDFDGDGIDDVVVADPDPGHRDPQPGMLMLYVNDPTQPKQIGGQAKGSRNFHAKILPQTVAGDRPTHVLAADCNGDGATDLIVANRDASTIRILLRRTKDQKLATLDYENPGLGFTASHVKGVPDFEVRTIARLGPVTGMRLVDIDGDQKDDLVLLLASTGRVQILGGLGGGRFDGATRRVARLPIARDARLSGFVVADLDGGGKLDAAVGSLDAKQDAGGGVIAISDIASAVTAER